MEARAAANSNTLNILRSKQDLSTWISAYTISVALVGAALVALALQRLPEDIFGLLLFAGLAALAELFSVELFVTSRNSRVSVSSIVAIASILLFGPMAGVLTHMASGIVTGVTNLKSQLSDGDVVSSLRRSSFNAP